jgi:hypothetical protein
MNNNKKKSFKMDNTKTSLLQESQPPDLPFAQLSETTWLLIALQRFDFSAWNQLS